MIISIASGKGGTGKTTVALGLASYIASRDIPVTILDCDVEEPNVNLFLKTDIRVLDTVYKPIPYVNDGHCDGCGKCEEICQFNSIVLVKGKPLVFHDMCHSCGGCIEVCPNRAINEEAREIGVIEEGYNEQLRYVGGALKISEHMSPPLIKAVKNHISSTDINIIDSPPGTTCPVIESVKHSDRVILVTEPTPFGLNDLKLAVEMVREMDIPFNVVINRFNIGDERVIEYCRKEDIDIIALLPESREMAEKYSGGDFMDYFVHRFSIELESMLSGAGIKILKKGSAL